MKVHNQVVLEFMSRSANESFARTAAACFLLNRKHNADFAVKLFVFKNFKATKNSRNTCPIINRRRANSVAEQMLKAAVEGYSVTG